MEHFYWLGQIHSVERPLVGDKAFYLSQLAQSGHPVVTGFTVGAPLLREFLETYNWSEPLFAELLNSALYLNVDDAGQLQAIAQHIRKEITAAQLPSAWIADLESAIKKLRSPVIMFRPSLILPVKSSSRIQLSGVLESYVCPAHPSDIALALKKTWAELFTARSLFYWKRCGIALEQLNLAVLVQPLWAGVLAAGFLEARRDTWEIKATWGLGKSITLGQVISDSYQVQPETGIIHSKQLGNKLIAYDAGLLEQATPTVGAGKPRTEQSSWLVHEQQIAEEIYPESSIPELLGADSCLRPYLLSEEQQNEYAPGSPYLDDLIALAQKVAVDVGSSFVLEWIVGKPDAGRINELSVQPQLYLTQVQPWETTKSPIVPGKLELTGEIRGRTLPESNPQPLIKGVGAASGRTVAPARVILSSEQESNERLADIPPGQILVAGVVAPEWLGIVRQAAGVIAEQGGMTSHAAILARELGIPAVVGAAGATQMIQTGESLLLDGDKGEIYRVSTEEIGELGSLPPSSPSSFAPSSHLDFPASALATQLLVNLSQPRSLERISGKPVDGIGLLRSELMALEIWGNQQPWDWFKPEHHAEFVERMSDRLTQLAQYFFPRPVFYRSLDLRSDEFPKHTKETNPTLGQHGTLSYLIDPSLFDLELTILDKLQRNGLTNIHLILPFVRSVHEFVFCRQRVQQIGLTRNGVFQLWIMAEVPSVLFLLSDYVQAGVQGIAIGSNDLTTLLLAADRDHQQMANLFDARHPAVRRSLHHLIQMAKQAGIPCSICGHAPAMYPELVDDLVRWGISSISVEPDALDSTYIAIARAEQRLLLEAARRQLAEE